MTISYKKLWQEATAQIDALKKENADLRNVIQTDPDDRLRLLERSRKVVDLAAIARHMHVARLTPQQWQQRELLPPVDFPDITGVPLWYASTIRDDFARATNRHWCDTPETCEIARREQQAA